MASIHKDFIVDAHPDQVWDVLRDFANVHQRLAPGFVLDSRMDGDEARIVTFSNGTVARELLVDCDDDRRRLVYAVISERLKQHSASAQVFAESDGRSRFIRIRDIDWIESQKNDVLLHVGSAEFLYHLSTSGIEAKLDSARFLRIHRSTIVNVERIKDLYPLFNGDYGVTLKDGTTLTLSSTYRKRLSAFRDGML